MTGVFSRAKLDVESNDNAEFSPPLSLIIIFDKVHVLTHKKQQKK